MSFACDTNPDQGFHQYWAELLQLTVLRVTELVVLVTLCTQHVW